jgi:uncharacterized protein DUF4149
VALVIVLLRLVGVMNAAVWFGAAVFLTFVAAPVFFTPTLKSYLGEVWPGVIASMVLEHYFVLQYICSIIALVHLFAEWLYLGKPLHRLTTSVLAALFLIAFSGGLWLQPRLKALHEVMHGYGRGMEAVAAQRDQAAKRFRALHGVSQTLNLLGLCGLAIYMWRVTTPPNGPRFVPATKFRS